MQIKNNTKSKNIVKQHEYIGYSENKNYQIKKFYDNIYCLRR